MAARSQPAGNHGQFLGCGLECPQRGHIVVLQGYIGICGDIQGSGCRVSCR